LTQPVHVKDRENANEPIQEEAQQEAMPILPPNQGTARGPE